MSTHTPKPWKASGVMVKDTTDTLGGMFRIITGDNEQFIFCTNEKDRHLIAAAPDLFAACQEALTRNGVDGDPALKELIRQAVNKAKRD